MEFCQGKSVLEDGRAAVAEATRDWGSAKPEIIFAFSSAKQDAAAVASALAERFPDSIVVGCTTTGEHLNGEHLRGALVLTAIENSGIRWATTTLEGLSGIGADEAAAAVRRLYAGLGVNPEEAEPSDYFCLSFIDGLRGREEIVTAHLAEALEGVKLIGGSAGDDLAFKETKVIAGGRAFTDGLVLVIGQAKGRFAMLKHQHFTTTTRRLAITKVDTAARRVYEMDGRPALDAYAAALGLAPEAVTGDVTFENPLTFTCRGEIYVRSISQVHDDKSMSFFCGIEEGIVVEVGGHLDIVDRLGEDLRTMTGEAGKFEFLLGWNCILRALETDKRGKVAEIGDAWRSAATASIGFDTYGEQLDGLHINQTLVAIGIKRAA